MKGRWVKSDYANIGWTVATDFPLYIYQGVRIMECIEEGIMENYIVENVSSKVSRKRGIMEFSIKEILTCIKEK